MKKSTQKVLDPKKDVLTRLKHLRALLGEARGAAGGALAGGSGVGAGGRGRQRSYCSPECGHPGPQARLCPPV